MPIAYEVSLRGMRYHARVGVLAHERELPQPITIDVTLWQAPPTIATLVESPLDYRDVESLVSGVMADEPIDYLETIAARVAQGAMTRERVTRVRVVVRKPHVALGVGLDGAEVALDVARDA